MSLPPSVSRALYKALQTSTKNLEHQLTRYPALRARETALLHAAASNPLPKDLRGLLNPHPSSSLQTTLSTYAHRILHASTAPPLAHLQAAVGFATLRHLNDRIDALRHLVYSTTSDAERHGITVGAESVFQGADRDRYFFRYRVRISNGSDGTVQLLSRAWTIRDLDGGVTCVRGPGVVGDFPTLAPTESYEYSSAVPLSTPVGTQSGHYVFVGSGGERMLEVPVAPFSHQTPSLDEGDSDGNGNGNATGRGRRARRR